MKSELTPEEINRGKKISRLVLIGVILVLVFRIAIGLK